MDNGFFKLSEMNAGFMLHTPWSRPDNTVAEEPHDAQNSPLERSERASEFSFTIEEKPTVETLRPDLLLGGRKIKSCTVSIRTPPTNAKQASSMRDGVDRDRGRDYGLIKVSDNLGISQTSFQMLLIATERLPHTCKYHRIQQYGAHVERAEGEKETMKLRLLFLITIHYF